MEKTEDILQGVYFKTDYMVIRIIVLHEINTNTFISRTRMIHPHFFKVESTNETWDSIKSNKVSLITESSY